jgi:hypothetical protein
MTERSLWGRDVTTTDQYQAMRGGFQRSEFVPEGSVFDLFSRARELVFDRDPPRFAEGKPMIDSSQGVSRDRVSGNLEDLAMNTSTPTEGFLMWPCPPWSGLHPLTRRRVGRRTLRACGACGLRDPGTKARRPLERRGPGEWGMGRGLQGS